MSPRAATPVTPPRPPRIPAAGSSATHHHSSSTLSSCRLLDCTPWAQAAASRLRLLLRLLPPAATRRPDKRAEGDGRRGSPRSKGSPERDGGGCREDRRAQSGVGSGADARHSAGVGLRAARLRGGSDHCGCAEGAAQLRSGGVTGPEWTPPARATAVLSVSIHSQSGGSHKRTLAPCSETRTRSSEVHPSILCAVVAPGPSLRTTRLLKRIPGCLDPSARAHAAPLPHRRDAPARARHVPRGPRGASACELPRAAPRLPGGPIFPRVSILVFSLIDS